MVVLRCTQKLLKRIGPASGTEAKSTTRLGDWHGNLLGMGHQRLVVFVSQHGRLPVLLPGRNLKGIGQALPLAVGAVLDRLGIPGTAVRAELDAMVEARIAASNDRSVLGTINDFSSAIRWWLYDEPGIELPTLALQLSRTPIGPMGYESPDRAVAQLFGVDAPGRAV